jgi:hypothetical protein
MMNPKLEAVFQAVVAGTDTATAISAATGIDRNVPRMLNSLAKMGMIEISSKVKKPGRCGVEYHWRPVQKRSPWTSFGKEWNVGGLKNDQQDI